MHFLFGDDEVWVSTGANHTPCKCINHNYSNSGFTHAAFWHLLLALKSMTGNQNLSKNLHENRV